jgi:hypothetical protein
MSDILKRFDNREEFEEAIDLAIANGDECYYKYIHIKLMVLN